MPRSNGLAHDPDGELLGLRAALLVTGISTLAVFPILLTSPLPRMREVPSAEPA